MTPLILLGVAALATPTAAADLCRPFAAVTAQMLVTQAWNRAYTICLNSDTVPPLPQDWVKALDLIKPTPVPLYTDPPGSVKATGAKVAGDTFKKCRATHPRSYDNKAHTYRLFSAGKWRPVPCPKD